MVAPLHVSALRAKSAAFAPESVTAPEPKSKLALPMFVTVMACAGPDVLAGWMLNVTLEGETMTAGAGAAREPYKFRLFNAAGDRIFSTGTARLDSAAEDVCTFIRKREE